ncbi:Sec-independent protein translocase subunit TatA/TatB [Hymenobacter jejuensis]|uniref:Sec-independent protein translocase protein TatA n=1 Tax=Hymenobacter jejuensis TaxID=2502781 RepID=A0A5B8A3J6_9BACT|nr:twin-arginine translocase TatA/TatE family subunit [Hymenobacter jejuensis]QDA61183.1 twin-arginine translocase TatA/TatE family subunit [Hymenobacter jejuensis]
MHTSLLLFLGDIGGSELILILVVFLMFFGANKIPELARGLGKGIREFKDATQEIRSEIENSGQSQPTHYQAPPVPQSYPVTPPAPAYTAPQTELPTVEPVLSPAQEHNKDFNPTV